MNLNFGDCTFSVSEVIRECLNLIENCHLLVHIMHFNRPIFVAGNQSILALIKANSRDLMIRRKLMLINLHQILSKIQLRHGALSNIE